MTLRVLHVVRRFGPVGGMERYVWSLTSALLDLGVKIELLCQSVECEIDPRITVHLVEPSSSRRRWRAMQDFRAKCDRFWLQFEGKSKVIVHSHERCSFHHVTTFHGPPMSCWFSTPWYQKISPRVRAWHRWEREELLGPSVRCIVPVSQLLGKRLRELYSPPSEFLSSPIEPAVDAVAVTAFLPPESQPKIVFVGKEWKRKGLIRALRILNALRLMNVDFSFDIFGPARSELKTIDLPEWATCKGWVTTVPYENYDLLIHPAEQEPFGMIVLEALAAGCRVIASENVGATSFVHPAMGVRYLDETDNMWALSLIELLGFSGDTGAAFPSWADVAGRYLSEAYSAKLL